MRVLVLVADADPFDLRLLSELCATLGYDVMTAADGGAVLDAMARQRPALVLMDAFLPVMDGFQVLRILKADDGFRHVPVLLVTGEHDTEARERGLSLGAEDYVAKPYRTFEIQQRLRNVLKLKAARDAVSEAHERAQSADPLTNAGTASQLYISLDYEFTRAVRYGHPLGCIVARCLNYTALLAAGASPPEQVLLPLSSVLKGAIRTVDHLFRSDVHEFTILLPETSFEGCGIVVERLRGVLVEPGLFACAQPPEIAVACSSYPHEQTTDGDALWRVARKALSV
ncbi:MAG TPA: response regulator [Polyangiales bacterium]